VTPEQARTLEAAMERILPGAAGLGAGGFAAAALAGRERGWWPLVEQGLAVLDGLAEEAGCTDFASAPAQAQDRLLGELAAMPAAPPRAFLRRLVQLTLEGCLADPRHGGNRDGAGWRLVGAAPPGSCRDEA
jgi:hypothetical protein